MVSLEDIFSKDKARRTLGQLASLPPDAVDEIENVTVILNLPDGEIFYKTSLDKWRFLEVLADTIHDARTR